MAGYYAQKTENLDLYQRLIQYWTLTFDKSADVQVLDHMNFHSKVFPPAITLSEIEKATTFEAGYASPDGSIEVEPVIKYLELARLNKFRPAKPDVNKRVIDEAGVGAGNGTTNAMNGVLNAILRLPDISLKKGNVDILFCIPNYSVYEAQARQLAPLCQPKFIRGKREHDFLVTFKQIEASISDKTVAIVVTFPTNPAQSTYEGEMCDDLYEMAKLCREKGIFFIVDNVYQDSMYPQRKRQHIELLGLFDSCEYLIKLFGPSKDTAFFPGYRFGYWIGDKRIQDNYRYHISATENTLGSVGLVMGSVDCLFRAKRQFGEALTQHDFELFNTGLFGWGREFDSAQLFDNFSDMGLYDKYNVRVDETDYLMELANKKARYFVEHSPVFSDFVNKEIGNVFFARINSDYFSGTDDELFHQLLQHGIGILPGNVFGMPIVKGEAWMRFTLIHDYWKNIEAGLRNLENVLLKNTMAVAP